MGKNQTVKQIDVMIRACVPVIAIQSAEEQRVISEVVLLAEKQKKRVMTWSAAIGFQQISPELGPFEKSPDPVASLVRVITEAQAEPPIQTIWIFNDLHQFMKNPVVMRAVRDVSHALRKVKGVTAILLGSSITVNPDARKDVLTVDFPLLVAEDLEEQLDTFISKLDSRVKVLLNGGRQELIHALQGLTKTEADHVLSQAVVTYSKLDERAIQFVMKMKAQIIKESGALEYFAQKANYSDIGGLDLLKNWARQAEASTSDAARAFGVEAPKAALLVGVPGCGKSLTAKAIAGPNRPLVRLDIGALFGSLVGQSEAQTRGALKIVEAIGRCVLWIDEIEKGLGGSGGQGDNGVSDKVLATILTWMQESKSDVFVIATANNIGGMRPELIRRFPVKFFVDLPQDSERRDIFAIHIAKRNRNPDAYDLDVLVKATRGFTGSEIEEVVQGGLMAAFSQGKDEVETSDFVDVIAQTVPLSTTMVEGIDEMRRWASRARPASSNQDSGHKAAKFNDSSSASYLELT